MKRELYLGLLLVLSLLMVACGGTAESTTAVDQEPEVEVAPAETQADDATIEEDAEVENELEEVVSGSSIVDLAIADGRFSTLVTAVEAAGLVETLSGEGEFTVFAPTDDAFTALPEGAVASLLKDPEGALTDVLLYHVAQGIVPAEVVITLDAAETLSGESVSITAEGSEVILNDDVRVIATDIEASNGIIHVIDSVLMPPSMVADATPQSILEIATQDERFSTLVTALEAAGLGETLAGEGSFTVFAPTDDAFAALPEGTIEALLADPRGALTDVLLYHVSNEVYSAESLTNLDAATTLQGDDVMISTSDDAVLLDNIYQVIAADIEASNGLIHVIDGVLLPSSVAEAEEMPNIADLALADGRFNILVAALETTGLIDTFMGEGQFTVFAPTDDAFATLPEGTLETLLADPQGALTDILLYHVVEGLVPAETVVTLESAPTLLGQDVTINVTAEGQVFLNDEVEVITTDVMASNGIIHVIDSVLIPAE